MIPADPSNIERAVSRTLRDSLDRMQRTVKELDQAVADFVAACASNRPSNALSPMLRAQTASASLAATLEVLSRFVTSSMQPANAAASAQAEQVEIDEPQVEAPPFAPPIAESIPQIEAPAAAEESVIEAAHAPEVDEWASVPEPAEFSAPQESQDSPEPAEEPESHEVEYQAIETHPAELHQPTDLEIDSPAVEPPPDPALEPVVESLLSPEVSVHPDALEPIATWAAPETPEEAAEPILASDEIEQDGIVDELEPQPVAEASSDATASEESRFIEEAIAAGLPNVPEADAAPEELVPEMPAIEAPAFDVATLSQDERELHRRASRVAKVSMQDIKLLQPQQVVIGRENKDICIRLHEEIERAHKEYDRRFKPIMSHPVDYFYDWMVEILAAGDSSALGEYPYHTPALRR